MKLLKILFTFLTMATVAVNARRAYKITIDNIQVVLPHKDILEVSLNLTQNSRGEQTMDMEYNIKQELPTVYMRALAKISNRNSEFVFINRTMNLCKFFQQKSTSVLTKMIFDEMANKGFHMKSCPVAVGSYASRGFHVNDNRFPPLIPYGRVTMRVEQLTGPSEQDMTLLADITLTATVKSNISKSGRVKG